MHLRKSTGHTAGYDLGSLLRGRGQRPRARSLPLTALNPTTISNVSAPSNRSFRGDWVAPCSHISIVHRSGKPTSKPPAAARRWSRAVSSIERPGPRALLGPAVPPFPPPPH